MYLAPHNVSNNSIPLQCLVSHSNPLHWSWDKFNSGRTHFASLGVISPGFTTSCPLSSKVTSTVTVTSCFFLSGLPFNCRKIFSGDFFAISVENGISLHDVLLRSSIISWLGVLCPAKSLPVRIAQMIHFLYRALKIQKICSPSLFWDPRKKNKSQ